MKNKFIMPYLVATLPVLLSACGGSPVSNSADTGPVFDGSSLEYVAIEGVHYPYCTDGVGDRATGWGKQDFGGGEQTCVVERGSIDPNASPVERLVISEDLVNPNADEVTLGVYRYLRSVFGTQILSGQQDLTWDDSIDMFQRVVNDTGLAPAIMGYDFMNYTGNVDAGSGLMQTEEAIEHWERGGLVTFCWHWRDPSDATYEFYTDLNDFFIPMDGDELDTSSETFAQIEADVDVIAQELLTLQEAGVPVLWRPLHEASGGWFWWGADGRPDATSPAQAQIALWQYLYERLTHHYELNNLIWVWNGQAANWYPGDDYVDIIGEDLYGTAQDYSSKVNQFMSALNYPDSTDKMVAITENGTIPDPDLMAEDGAWWLYFVTWNDGNSEEGVTNSNNFWTGEYYNENDHKIHVYHHELVITLDQLPDFR
ncbi:glycosyl hydrolase [Marinimicrobium sp. ABcell2]|uniref:glycosyl hydrolase n=1 Tax=Marinimicrobium sp. ABcell2 TaxID=3069751 RepID=UPI0027B23DE5|nr:glycosyl hydrolase [Marinimicrobium sp. ABcell2]MDQ2076404.1 glycosyl hydrolase [Marinimicrobium sp. ABcell2]